MNVEALTKHCAELTAINDHGAAYLAAAQGLGLDDLAGRFARINRRHLELGHLPDWLNHERYQTYQEMMTYARNYILSESEYERFYDAF